MMNNAIPVITIRDLKYSKGPNPVVIPTGTKLDLYFRENRHATVGFIHDGINRALSVGNLHATAKPTNGMKFHKMPSVNRLQKMSNDGICTTVTGERTEPDGTAYDGSSSWLLVAGLI